jgi:hypothetical protein
VIIQIEILTKAYPLLIAQGRGQKAAVCVLCSPRRAGCFLPAIAARPRISAAQKEKARIQMSQSSLITSSKSTRALTGFDFLPTLQCGFNLRGIHAARTQKYKCGAGVFCFY